jgi:acetyltransferase EpsM
MEERPLLAVEETPLLVLGTRTLALEIADLAADTPGLRVSGFVENMEAERCREPLAGHPVYWVDEIGPLSGDHVAVCGLATTQRGRFVDQVAAHALGFATLIHPTAHVSGTTSVGEGSIVSAGAVIGAYSDVGRHVLVNRGALVGHHTEVGDFVSIQPGANVAGACRIGALTYVGMSAAVLDHVTVGTGCIIGAGAVVTRDVPDRVQVVGVPAEIVKEGIEPK